MDLRELFVTIGSIDEREKDEVGKRSEKWPLGRHKGWTLDNNPAECKLRTPSEVGPNTSRLQEDVLKNSNIL